MNLDAIHVDDLHSELIEDFSISEKELQASLARDSLLDFTKYTKPEYQVNWHHRVLCEKLDKLYAGELKRLMVFVGPRMGKSELVSRRFPAYVFGKNPNTKIISCSYGADLARRMNRDVQRIIDTPRYSDVFPDTKLSGKSIRASGKGEYLRNSELFEIVGYEGTYISAGVGGAITGSGGQILLIDDVIKNAEEAESEVYRNKVWEWFTSTFYTRAEKDARIAIVMTRWHDSDLCGRLLSLMEKDPLADHYEVVSFPTIKEESHDNPDDPREIGEPIWPEKYDINALNKIKSTLGLRNWNALHQQSPVTSKGNIFKRSWFQFFKNLPVTWDLKSISWDFNFGSVKGNQKEVDYVVGEVWVKVGANKYLIDLVRDKMTFTEAISAMIALNAKHSDANENIVEAKANGPAIIDSLKTKISGIIPYTPDTSKEARANAIAPQFEAGNIFIPHPDIASWAFDFIEELVRFPFGKNDDFVDSCTQYLLRNSGSSWIDELVNERDRSPEVISDDVRSLFGWD